MQSSHSAVVESPAHAWFLGHLPEIRSRCRAALTRLRAESREEATAEVTAAVFKAAVHAARNGTLGRVTPYHAVAFAVRQFRQGRRVAGYSSTDVTSEAAQAKGRAKVSALPAGDGRDAGAPAGACRGSLSDELADRRRHADPYEQARQNLDYPQILERERVSAKAKALFGMLSAARGRGRGMQIARALNVSEGRVSQLKQQLAEALTKHEYAPA
jgi:hypothetical protein